MAAALSALSIFMLRSAINAAHRLLVLVSQCAGESVLQGGHASANDLHVADQPLPLEEHVQFTFLC